MYNPLGDLFGLEAANLARAAWELRPGIEVRTYDLSIPLEDGSTDFDTEVSTDEFPAAAISDLLLHGEDCDYSRNAKIWTRHVEGTWRILVFKESGCDHVAMKIIYIPREWVDELHTTQELTPIK